jgi:phosphoglycolate phosphatase-like HAD superfamily hydrolase
MVLRGLEEFRLEPKRSFVIGDRCVDMEAGRSAGCATGLVLTGYGETERRECEQRRMVDFAGEDIGAVWNTIKGLIRHYA